MLTGDLAAHCLRVGHVGACYNKSHCCLAGGLRLLSFLSCSDSRRIKQRTQIQNGGRDTKLLPYFQLIPGPKSGVSVPLQKLLMYLLHTGAYMKLVLSLASAWLSAV
jgi:hypothetical protein